MELKFNQKIPITSSWKLAALTLWVHAFKCNRTTLFILIVLAGTFFIAGTLLGYSFSDVQWGNIWKEYHYYIIFLLLFIHFVPVNIFVITRMMNKPFYGERYILSLCKTNNEEVVSEIKNK